LFKVSEIESVVLRFIRIIRPCCWSISQIQRAFAADATGMPGALVVHLARMSRSVSPDGTANLTDGKTKKDPSSASAPSGACSSRNQLPSYLDRGGCPSFRVGNLVVHLARMSRSVSPDGTANLTDGKTKKDPAIPIPSRLSNSLSGASRSLNNLSLKLNRSFFVSSESLGSYIWPG
jgi:hypothetical protein